GVEHQSVLRLPGRSGGASDRRTVGSKRMKRTHRRWYRVVLGRVAGAICIGAFPGAASAHPLGNLSVNHFHGLTIQPDRIIDDAVVDTAEIPTAQTQGSLDTNHDGTTANDELDAYGRSQCAALSAALSLAV